MKMIKMMDKLWFSCDFFLGMCYEDGQANCEDDDYEWVLIHLDVNNKWTLNVHTITLGQLCDEKEKSMIG